MFVRTLGLRQQRRRRDRGTPQPQVVDAVRHVLRAVHDHARQHGRERRAAVDPADAASTTPENLEWTINAYVLTFAALILLGGKLGDRFGRKRMFLVGLAIFTLASARVRAVPTDTQLIAFRVAAGRRRGAPEPAVAVDPGRRVPAQAAAARRSASGPASPASAWRSARCSAASWSRTSRWSAVFWINVPIGVVAAVVTCWAVVESRDPTRQARSTSSAPCSSPAACSRSTWGLIKTDSHSWTSPYTLGFLARRPCCWSRLRRCGSSARATR